MLLGELEREGGSGGKVIRRRTKGENPEMNEIKLFTARKYERQRKGRNAR